MTDMGMMDLYGAHLRAPEEREAPRCGGTGRIVLCEECRVARRCPGCPDCSPRSETDGGLLGALARAEREMVPDPDGAVSYDRAEAALLIGALREHLDAWRDAEPADDLEDELANSDLLTWLWRALR